MSKLTKLSDDLYVDLTTVKSVRVAKSTFGAYIDLIVLTDSTSTQFIKTETYEGAKTLAADIATMVNDVKGDKS